MVRDLVAVDETPAGSSADDAGAEHNEGSQHILVEKRTSDPKKEDDHAIEEKKRIRGYGGEEASMLSSLRGQHSIRGVADRRVGKDHISKQIVSTSNQYYIRKNKEEKDTFFLRVWLFSC
jgi:hypothetical protein